MFFLQNGFKWHFRWTFVVLSGVNTHLQRQGLRIWSHFPWCGGISGRNRIRSSNTDGSINDNAQADCFGHMRPWSNFRVIDLNALLCWGMWPCMESIVYCWSVKFINLTRFQHFLGFFPPQKSLVFCLFVWVLFFVFAASFWLLKGYFFLGALFLCSTIWKVRAM